MSQQSGVSSQESRKQVVTVSRHYLITQIPSLVRLLAAELLALSHIAEQTIIWRRRPEGMSGSENELFTFHAREGLMRFLSLRAIFLLGFVVAMPILALPPVARRIDELLYGPAPSDFAQPPQAAPPLDEPQPLANGHILPARFEEPSPAAVAVTPGPANRPFSPPPLAASPDFAPAPPPLNVARTGTAEPKVDERTMARLQQIRQQLEQLGAEHVLVETQDGGRFRFHCRMLVDDRTRFTRPFEASSFDCLAAGEQVLRDVETWRLAARAGEGQPVR
jgi:hypothetical protein